MWRWVLWKKVERINIVGVMMKERKDLWLVVVEDCKEFNQMRSMKKIPPLHLTINAFVRCFSFRLIDASYCGSASLEH
jgi:hypothetical protein